MTGDGWALAALSSHIALALPRVLQTEFFSLVTVTFVQTK
jgi:hypothetical protein